jgi:hypothetical protein
MTPPIRQQQWITIRISLLILACSVTSILLADASAADGLPPPPEVGSPHHASYLRRRYVQAIRRSENDALELVRASTRSISSSIGARASKAADAPSSARRRRLQQQSTEQPGAGGGDPAATAYGDHDSTTDPSYAFEFGQTITENTPEPHSFDILQFIPSKSLPFRPLTDPYVISDNIPWLDLTKLEYTNRDWSRWDGFDATTDLLYTPTSFGNPDVENEGSRVWGIGNGRAKQVQTSIIAALGMPSSAAAQTLTPQVYQRLPTTVLHRHRPNYS